MDERAVFSKISLDASADPTESWVFPMKPDYRGTKTSYSCLGCQASLLSRRRMCLGCEQSWRVVSAQTSRSIHEHHRAFLAWRRDRHLEMAGLWDEARWSREVGHVQRGL